MGNYWWPSRKYSRTYNTTVEIPSKSTSTIQTIIQCLDWEYLRTARLMPPCLIATSPGTFLWQRGHWCNLMCFIFTPGSSKALLPQGPKSRGRPRSMRHCRQCWGRTMCTFLAPTGTKTSTKSYFECRIVCSWASLIISSTRTPLIWHSKT